MPAQNAHGVPPGSQGAPPVPSAQQVQGAPPGSSAQYGQAGEGAYGGRPPQGGTPSNGAGGAALYPVAEQREGAAGYPAADAFEPGAGLAWSRISPRYPWHRRIAALVRAIPVAAVGAFLLWRGGGTVAALLWVAGVLAVLVVSWVVVEVAYRSYGYAERGDDLIVTSGVFVRRLIVVPYGRMQFVDVTAGLLERWMGIATVRLHTAAAATDAVVPGLPAAEAALLRDRLAHKGEERSMGL
ncbi:PH domain-containing protein [Spirillospora sp. NPDC052269]